MRDFKYLTDLPGTPREQDWLRERLETLSVKENCVLAAAVELQPPESMADAVNCLQSLDGYPVRFPAGNCRRLGEYHLFQTTPAAEEVLPYVNLAQLGQQYMEKHPGCFVEGCYVEYPVWEPDLYYKGQGSLLPEDNGWSIKLKLSSPSCPEGVWLRLPDGGENMVEESAEVRLALDALQVESLEDCTLLDARCILPETGDLMKQYDSITELVRDGENLGFVLGEQGQGVSHWREKFAAALEYEDCRTLRFALDISQNLSCYEWVTSEELADFAVSHLRSCGMGEDLIQSGAIDLQSYAEDLLESAGYMRSSGEIGYLIRNGRKFIHDFTTPEQSGMTMQ